MRAFSTASGLLSITVKESRQIGARLDLDIKEANTWAQALVALKHRAYPARCPGFRRQRPQR